MQPPTLKPLLSPHRSLVSCLVGQAREENIKPFQVSPSRRLSETSALETQVVPGISPKTLATERSAPRSAPASSAAGRAAPGAPGQQRRAPQHGGPHLTAGREKSATSRRPITPSARSLQPITAGERARRTNRRRSCGAGGGFPYREALPPHLTPSRSAAAEEAALCRGVAAGGGERAVGNGRAAAGDLPRGDSGENLARMPRIPAEHREASPCIPRISSNSGMGNLEQQQFCIKMEFII